MIGLLLVGCSAMQTEGDWFVVRNDGADMPVTVRGDLGSDTFVVWLSGGPGDPAVIDRGEATDRLEEDLGMVYWDQRGAGSAGGNAKPESFTIDQYVDDTEAVVDVIEDLYAPEHLFLLGHSWGGTLGTAYLLDPDRQAEISGWIDVDGNHDNPLIFPMKIAWLGEYAEEQIAKGVDVAHWTEVRDWCASEPALTVDNWHEWNELVGDTNALFHDPDVGYDVDFELLFLSPESPLAYFAVNDGYADASMHDDDSSFETLSFSDEMDAIETPTLLAWGRYDGIVPIQAMDAARESLTNAPVETAVFDAGHCPFLEEPQPFAEAVLDFVQQ
jgi:pimeloyl-ACP methyl ester carboxylesterase